MIKEFNIQELRFWSQNPRYTNFKKVKILEIGREDFDENKNDIYFQNISKYYKNLIKNKKMVEKLLELVENIAISGFETDTEHILVTFSPYLVENYGEKFKNVIYVLEGNRRLFALSLLLNLNNSREILKKILNSEDYNKFNKIFAETKFDTFKIPCNFYDIKSKGEKYTWKILNQRHFGKRKGKLNWSRGTALNIIFSTIKNFRDDNNILDGEEILNYEEMIKVVEAYTGKKISMFDLNGALWSIKVIENYNQQVSAEKKILLENTDDEMDALELDSTDDHQTDFDIKKDNNDFFSISSLELAYNTIKLPNNVGDNVSLKEKINLDINIKKWYINTNLSEKKWNNLCFYLVESVKNKKLNTRKFKNEYLEEILGILSDDYNLSIKIIESTKNNKINFQQLNLISIKNIKESKIIFDNPYEEKIYKLIKDLVIPQTDKIIELIYFLESKLNLIKDKTIYSLLYIWCKEFKPLILSKLHLQPLCYPYFSISALLRSTSELLCNLWAVNDANLQKAFCIKFKNSNNKIQSKNYLEHINDAIIDNNFNDHILNEYDRECSGKNLIKFVTQDQIKDIKNLLLEFFKSIEKNSNHLLHKFFIDNKIKISLKIEDYAHFILWTHNTDKLNRILHKSHFIYDVTHSFEVEILSSQLSLNFNIIISLLEYIKLYFSDNNFIIFNEKEYKEINQCN